MIQWNNSSRNTAKRYFSATLNQMFFNVTYSVHLREKYPFVTLSLSLFTSVCHLFYFYPLSLTLSIFISNSLSLSFCRLLSASLSPSLLLCQSNFWISCLFTFTPISITFQIGEGSFSVSCLDESQVDVSVSFSL